MSLNTYLNTARLNLEQAQQAHRLHIAEFELLLQSNQEQTIQVDKERHEQQALGFPDPKCPLWIVHASNTLHAEMEEVCGRLKRSRDKIAQAKQDIALLEGRSQPTRKKKNMRHADDLKYEGHFVREMEVPGVVVPPFADFFAPGDPFSQLNFPKDSVSNSSNVPKQTESTSNSIHMPAFSHAIDGRSDFEDPFANLGKPESFTSWESRQKGPCWDGAHRSMAPHTFGSPPPIQHATYPEFPFPGKEKATPKKSRALEVASLRTENADLRLQLQTLRTERDGLFAFVKSISKAGFALTDISYGEPDSDSDSSKLGDNDVQVSSGCNDKTLGGFENLKGADGVGQSSFGPKSLRRSPFEQSLFGQPPFPQPSVEQSSFPQPPFRQSPFGQPNLGQFSSYRPTNDLGPSRAESKLTRKPLIDAGISAADQEGKKALHGVLPNHSGAESDVESYNNSSSSSNPYNNGKAFNASLPGDIHQKEKKKKKKKKETMKEKKEKKKEKKEKKKEERKAGMEAKTVQVFPSPAPATDVLNDHDARAQNARISSESCFGRPQHDLASHSAIPQVAQQDVPNTDQKTIRRILLNHFGVSSDYEFDSEDSVSDSDIDSDDGGSKCSTLKMNAAEMEVEVRKIRDRDGDIRAASDGQRRLCFRRPPGGEPPVINENPVSNPWGSSCVCGTTRGAYGRKDGKTEKKEDHQWEVLDPFEHTIVSNTT